MEPPEGSDIAVQIARTLGARVTGVCGCQQCRAGAELRADETVIDYSREDFTTRSDVHDVVLDAVGKEPFSRCRRVPSPSGTYITTLPTVGLSFVV